MLEDSESDEDEELTVPSRIQAAGQVGEKLDDTDTEDEDLSVALPSATISQSKRGQHDSSSDARKRRRLSLRPDAALFDDLDHVRFDKSREGAERATPSHSKQGPHRPRSSEDPIRPENARPNELREQETAGASIHVEKPFFTGKPLNPRKDVLLGVDGDKTVLSGCVAQWLRPYQIDGIMFMYDLYSSKCGGILGDDMGLGKTVQVISFLNVVFGKSGRDSDWKRMREMRELGEEYPVVLIICPGTLIDNWSRELETWSWTHVAVYHGTDKDAALQSISQGRSEVLITTYNTYKTNASRLNAIKWDVVIADECHIIKEKKSQITQAANLVNSNCRIGLTGTAIQNNYDELFTLLDWTNPGAFGTAAEWNKKISSVLKNGQKHTATNKELAIGRRTAMELCKVTLPRVLLRRTKALIAHQLPKKTDKVVFCPLTPLQITAYDNLMGMEEVTFLRDSKKPCDCGSSKARGICCYSESASGKTFAELLFPYLHYLRNLSNHMALCLPRNNDVAWKQARAQELLEEALPDHWRRLTERPPMQNGCDPDLCGKWKVLQQLLMHWKSEGSKVLVFSSSVKLLDMLNDLMMQENYLYEYLHGGMTLDARSAAVKNFNENNEQFVFLISTRAGGVGLNIVSANKVVIFDPNWNPAHDLQAQDRAYRIGQSRDVEVYRLISTGTVEEVVYARQVYKQQQANIGYEASEEPRYFRGVQGDSDQRGELFGVENLLTFHGENHILKAIFDDTSQAESNFRNIKMASIDINATQEDLEAVNAKDQFGINAIVNAQLGSETRTEQESQQDAISRILMSAGVRYSHQNNEVVGRSEIEKEISRVAAQASASSEHQNRQAYLATILKSQQRAHQRTTKTKNGQSLITQSFPERVPIAQVDKSTNGKKRTLPWTR